MRDALADMEALESVKRELMFLLDRELKAGMGGAADQRRDFRLHDPKQGFLLGCITNDDRSPDVKAQGRHPTILRAAVIQPMKLTAAEEENIINQLTQRWPEQSGQDQTLTVEFKAPVTRTRVTPDAQPRRAKLFSLSRIPRSKFPRFSMKPFLIIVSVFIVAACWMVSWWQKDGADAALQPMIADLHKYLAQWGENEPAQNEAAIDHFFHFLSQQAVGVKIPESKTLYTHPYIQFVRRLPDIGAMRKQEHWTAQEADHALNELADRLSDIHHDADSHDADALLRVISQKMDYDGWRGHKGRNTFQPEYFVVEPPPEMIKYVEKFLSKSEKTFSEAAETMKKALSDWKIHVRDPAHPFAVMEQFFTELRPPQLSISVEDSDSAYAQFATRFKDNKGSLGWTCDDINELNYALKKLIGQKSTDLQLFGNDEDPSGLVEKVRQRTKLASPSDDSNNSSAVMELRKFARKFNPTVH